MDKRKTVLITGAASGIGREFVDIFAEEKYDMVIVGRNMEKMCALKEEYEEKNGIAITPLQIDLSEEDGARRVYDEVKERGIEVDVLINNAGVTDYGRFVDIPWERERAVIELNVLSLTRLMQLFAADMEKRGSGKILNVASIAAYMPGPYMPVYFATKSFVYSLSQAVAKELAGTGVTVTCLCPGTTATNFEKEGGIGEESKLFKILKPMTAKEVALDGYRAMMKGKTVRTVGFFNRCLKFVCRFGSDKLKRDLTKKINAGK